MVVWCGVPPSMYAYKLASKMSPLSRLNAEFFLCAGTVAYRCISSSYKCIYVYYSRVLQEVLVIQGCN
jgi:hypothetical protein